MSGPEPLPGAGSELFGSTVFLKNEWLFIGAPRSNVNSVTQSGKVHVYKKNTGSSNYTLHQTLTGDNLLFNSHFGRSIFMRGDTLLIGRPQGANGGEVNMFLLNNGNWVSHYIFNAPTEKRAVYFGGALHMHNGKIIIGAPGYFVYGKLQGVAFIYGFANNNWQEEAILTAPDAEWGDAFGSSVVLTDQGAWVGSPGISFPSNTDHGRIYFFKK